MSHLHLHQIEHEYATRPVLGPLDMRLQAGEAVALVGPSGCGKTTLLNIASGLLYPTRGAVDNQFHNPALMFQQPRLLPWQNALDNIALGLKARGVRRNERQRRALVLAEQLGLSAADLQLYPAALSGGMQSRVALARALLPEPDLLFLDEAFAALDIGLKTELYDHLNRTRQQLGCAILMITHDPQEAMRLADRILVLGSTPGRILAEFCPGPRNGLTDEDWLLSRNREFLALTEVRQAFQLR